jgi:hypothetical protein
MQVQEMDLLIQMLTSIKVDINKVAQSIIPTDLASLKTLKTAAPASLAANNPQNFERQTNKNLRLTTTMRT